MSFARGALKLGQNVRNITTSTIRNASQGEVHPGYKKLKPIQERFGIEDGTPVHLKGGVFDGVFYRVTMGVCVGAVLWNCKLYFDLSVK